MTRPLRTVVWSTGGVGSIAIDAIRRRPDLELVGAWVHSEDKVGKDAGELAAGEPMGVAAKSGNASFYASGVFPGFGSDQLALLLATQSKKIRCITVTEVALNDHYPVAE